MQRDKPRPRLITPVQTAAPALAGLMAQRDLDFAESEECGVRGTSTHRGAAHALKPGGCL